MRRCLIISAHPDDDILGCGGMMAKYKGQIQFKVVFIAEGSSCRYRENELQTERVQSDIEERNKSGIRALKILAIEDFTFHNLPCGRLDQVPIIEINKIIEDEVDAFQPDTIFTHSDTDTNNDHIIVHKSTLMATRPNARNYVENVYAYEVLSSSEWKYTKIFEPNYFETLTEEQVALKWNALGEYESEIKDFPFPRSFEGISTLAKFRGMQSGTSYAEAFRIIRKIN